MSAQMYEVVGKETTIFFIQRNPFMRTRIMVRPVETRFGKTYPLTEAKGMLQVACPANFSYIYPEQVIKNYS